MQTVIYTIVVLGVLGLVGALVLYLTAKRFHVEEDERIGRIEDLLPGANCGACGRNGCHDFACACVEKGSLEDLVCPGASAGAMDSVAEILGVAPAADRERFVAVLKCNGACTVRPRVYEYDGAESCAVMDAVGVGRSGCAYGCLGCGDCVGACRFGSLSINRETGLAEVDPQACTGCGACAAECPRRLLEMRPVGRRERRVWVACSNRDKGAVARKVCVAACIACGKCSRECPFEAIDVSGNLAYIDAAKCKTCGKCIGVCPTGAISATFAPAVVNEKI